MAALDPNWIQEEAVVNIANGEREGIFPRNQILARNQE